MKLQDLFEMPVKVDANLPEPLVYNSANIADSELWSENGDKKYTLFALKMLKR